MIESKIFVRLRDFFSGTVRTVVYFIFRFCDCTKAVVL